MPYLKTSDLTELELAELQDSDLVAISYNNGDGSYTSRKTLLNNIRHSSADRITVDATNFDTNLLPSNTTVQSALDRLDNYDPLDDESLDLISHWSSEKTAEVIRDSVGGYSGVVSYRMPEHLKILENVISYEIPALSGDIDFYKQYILVDGYAEDDRTGNSAYPIEGQIDFTQVKLRECIITLPDARLVQNKIYTIANRRILVREDSAWSVLLQPQFNQVITGLHDESESSFSQRLSVGGVGGSIQIISDGSNWVLLNKYGGTYFEGGAHETDVCFVGENAGQGWSKYALTHAVSKYIRVKLFQNISFSGNIKPTFVKKHNQSFSEFDIASMDAADVMLVQNPEDDYDYFIWVKYNGSDPFLVRFSGGSDSDAYGFRGCILNSAGYPDITLYNRRDYVMYETIAGDIDSWVCLYKNGTSDLVWTEMTDSDNHDEKAEFCDDLIFLGHSSGLYNKGQSVISIGEDNCQNNIGNGVIAIGEDTALNNKCDNSIFIGNWSGFSAGSNDVSCKDNIGFGEASLRNIAGSYNLGFGINTGVNAVKNEYDQCIFLGTNAGKENSKSHKFQIINSNSNINYVDEDDLDNSSFMTGIMEGHRYLNINANLSVKGQIVSSHISQIIPNISTPDSVISKGLNETAAYFTQSTAEFATSKFNIGDLVEIETGDVDSEIVKVIGYDEGRQRTYIDRDISKKFISTPIPTHPTGSTLIKTNILNCDTGNMHDIDLTGETTTFNLNMINLKKGGNYIIKIKQNTGTHIDLTFSQTILWNEGMVYETTKSDGAIDIIQLLYDGVTLYGNIGLNYT